MQNNDVPIITLRSGDMQCSLSAIGASLTDVSVTMPNGDQRSVALSPLTHLCGSFDPSLAGRTVAPCCGRVRDARITIGRKEFELDRNEGSNHIHGGFSGTALSTWETRSVSKSEAVFALDLPDGLGGYPGNRHITAAYTIEARALTVRYSCVSDAPTWFDITNHAYWDLSGRFDGSAMDQLLTVSSLSHVRNNENHLPMMISGSEGTCFDFSVPTAPSAMLRQYPDDDQLRIALGFNNALLLDPSLIRKNGFAAQLTSPNSDLTMRLHTDRPSIVFYSGGFLGADTPVAGGASVPGGALALEAQALPDPFHLPGAVPEILQPGTEVSHFIRWEFDFGENR